MKTIKASALLLAFAMLIALIPAVSLAESNIIPEITVKNVVLPVGGASPDVSCDFTDSSYNTKYTVDNRDWYDAEDPRSMTYFKIDFIEGNEYLYQITLKAKDGRRFDKNQTHITVSGKKPFAVEVHDNGSVIYITQKYRALKPIEQVNALINGFYAGYMVSTVTVKSAEPDRYSIKSFEIRDGAGNPCSDDQRLEQGKTYEIYVKYKSKSGYGFTDSTKTLNNGVPTENDWDGYEGPTAFSSISYKEPTVKTGIEEVELTIPVPVKGETPADAVAAEDAEGYTVASTAWTPECTEFEGGTVYTAAVVLKADEEYRFTPKTQYFINGERAKVVKDYWEKSTISFTFEATEGTAQEEPTAAPEEPTAAPEEPTAAPEEPTAAPEEPTAAPEEPTAAPEEPTAAPPANAGLSETVIIILAVIGGLLLIAVIALSAALIVRKKR